MSETHPTDPQTFYRPAPAGTLVNVPHWHEAEFLEAVVDGTAFPHELTITAQNQALAAIVHAVLSRRGYTITRDMVDPLTVHARTMLASSPLP